MEAMVLKIEPVGQGTFEQYGPWHFRDQRYSEDGLGEALLQVAPAVAGLKDSILKTSTNWSIQVHSNPISALEERQRTAAEARDDARSPESITAACASTSGVSSPCTTPCTKHLSTISAFSFNQAISRVQESFDFSFIPQYHNPPPSTKRPRAVSDVDGPNTALLGCKKRRLRKDLVTSRLSRPFSFPASHIINRECVMAGDKRNLKLAAVISARRMSTAASTPVHQINHPPSPSSLLRRAAVINRFRLNVKNRAAERGDDHVADMATNAALLQQNHGIGFVVGARFPVTLSSAPLLAGTSGLGVPQQNIPPFQLSLAAVDARPRVTYPRPKAADATRLKLPPSPKIRPLRSPELRSTRPPYPADLDEEDGLDDEEVAFPTSEHESRYETSDEPEDVYADFGMIFGGGSADDESSDDEADHFEDYMDDVDGIPWTAR